MQKNYFRVFFAAFAFVLFSSLGGFAQTAPQTFPNVNIKNFGQMDEHYYRGAQPAIGDYQSLKTLGVKTVIDLRNDPTDYEKAEVEKLGMTYINIPMSGWKYPKSTDIERFLQIVNDPNSGTIYAHCKAGIHRTGITAAVYRMTKYGWDYEKSYQEMKNYNFSSGLVHGSLKTFVKDYAANLQKQKEQAKSAESPKTSQVLNK